MPGSLQYKQGDFSVLDTSDGSVHIKRMGPDHIWLVVGLPSGESITIDFHGHQLTGAIRTRVLNDGFKQFGIPNSLFTRYREVGDTALDALYRRFDLIAYIFPDERIGGRGTHRWLGLLLLIISTLATGAMMIGAGLWVWKLFH